MTMIDRYTVADIYNGNNRVHQLVDIDEAREFVRDKREEEGGTSWALQEVEVTVFDVEYIIKDNPYGDIHRLNKEDFDGIRVSRNEVKVRNPERWGNPSDGETVRVASYKRNQGKPRSNIPADSIPNHLD